jgi:Zn-finger nucleic acid-binding protein
MDCPKCLGKLETREIEEEKTLVDKDLAGAAEFYTLEYDQCFVCGGVWLDKGELEKIVADGITVIHSDSMGKDLDKEMDKKIGKCPRCGVVMKKEPFDEGYSITIDKCEKCGGVWLDPTEIDRIESINSIKSHKKGFFKRVLEVLKKRERDQEGEGTEEEQKE